MQAMAKAIKAKVNYYVQKALKYFSRSKAAVPVKPTQEIYKGQGQNNKTDPC